MDLEFRWRHHAIYRGQNLHLPSDKKGRTSTTLHIAWQSSFRNSMEFLDFFQDLIGGYNMNQHDTTQLTQKSSPFRNHRPWCHDIPLAPPAYSSGISSNSPYKRSKPRAEDSRRIRSFSKREVHQIVMWILRSWLMLKTWILCPFCVSGLIQLQGFQGRKKSIFIGRFPFAIQCMLSSKAQMPPNIPWGAGFKGEHDSIDMFCILSVSIFGAPYDGWPTMKNICKSPSQTSTKCQTKSKKPDCLSWGIHKLSTSINIHRWLNHQKWLGQLRSASLTLGSQLRFQTTNHSSRGTKDRIELMTLMPQTCLDVPSGNPTRKKWCWKSCRSRKKL